MVEYEGFVRKQYRVSVKFLPSPYRYAVGECRLYFGSRTVLGIGRLGEKRALRDSPPSRRARTLRICHENSLLSVWNSLLFGKFPLLTCLGNLLKSPCGTAVSCSVTSVCLPKFVIFPVKFPVCREFARRQVRSALRHQPATHSTYDSLQLMLRNPLE